MNSLNLFLKIFEIANKFAMSKIKCTYLINNGMTPLHILKLQSCHHILPSHLMIVSIVWSRKNKWIALNKILNNENAM